MEKSRQDQNGGRETHETRGNVRDTDDPGKVREKRHGRQHNAQRKKKSNRITKS